MNNTNAQIGLLHLFGALTQSNVPLVRAIAPAIAAYPEFKELLQTLDHKLNTPEESTTCYSAFDNYFPQFVSGFLNSGSKGGSIEFTFMKAAKILRSMERQTRVGILTEKTFDEVNYFRLFGSFLNNDGVLAEALKIAGDQYLQKNQEAKIDIHRSTILEGESITKGFEKHTDLFCPTGLSYMYAGESSGTLGESCESYADLRELQLLGEKEEAGKGTDRAARILEYGHLSFLFGYQKIPIENVILRAGMTVPASRKKAYAELFAHVNVSKLGLGEAMALLPEDFEPWIAQIVIESSKNKDGPGLDLIFQLITETIVLLTYSL